MYQHTLGEQYLVIPLHVYVSWGNAIACLLVTLYFIFNRPRFLRLGKHNNNNDYCLNRVKNRELGFVIRRSEFETDAEESSVSDT